MKHQKSPTKIENQHVFLTSFLVKAIGNCSGLGFFMMCMRFRKASTSILGRLPLAIIEKSWHSDHSILHLLAQVSLGDLFHLDQHHSRNLLAKKQFLLALVLHLDLGFPLGTGNNFEGKALHVRLHGRIIEFAAYQAFRIKHCVLGIH